MQRTSTCAVLLLLALFTVSLTAQFQWESPTADTCDAERVYKFTAVDDLPELLASVDHLERELSDRLTLGPAWSGRLIVFLVINCDGKVAAMSLQTGDLPEFRETDLIRQYFTEDVRWRPARYRPQRQPCDDGGYRVDCVYPLNIQVEKGRVILRALRQRRGMKIY